METATTRHLRVDGTRNLRDVGGYPTVDGRRTRWRTVFRSDCLDQLTPTSQTELLALGVRTIIDIRDQAELRERPNVFANSALVSYRWLPIWDEPLPNRSIPDVTGGYRREFDLRGEQLARICRDLLSPDALPALIHCAAGKDRTGVVVALLLSIARVPPTVIVEDYALSTTCLGPEFLEEGRQWVTGRGWSWEEYSHLWDAPTERMVRTLEHLEQRWGGAEQYLQQHGLRAQEIGDLRARLTEAPG